MSSWILQSITLFLGLLAAIPLLRAILGLTLVAISESFNLKNPMLRKAGIKMMPAFLRATLGLGLAIGVSTPAMADTLPPEIPIIDRVIDFETSEEPETVVEVAAEAVVEKPSQEIPKNAKTYRVKSGDSLWKIAQEHVVREGASIEEIDSAWRAIWRINKDVIGDNPSLIRPGQEIRIDVFSK